MMEECICGSYYESNCKRNEQLRDRNKIWDKKNIESIIKASKMREETLHKKSTPLLENNPELEVKYHLSCTDKYCSTKAVLRNEPAQKTRRRSDELKFDPKTMSILWFKMWSQTLSKTPQQM